jgi:hypothetical protein
VTAFQTVVALAEADCEGQPDEIPKITRHHIKEVVRISKEFKEYLDVLYKNLGFQQLASRKGIRAEIGSDDRGTRGGLMPMHRRNETHTEQN